MSSKKHWLMRLAFSWGLIVMWLGFIAGFGGWAEIGLSIASGHEFGLGVGVRIFGALVFLFFSGAVIGGTGAMVYLQRKIWIGEWAGSFGG